MNQKRRAPELPLFPRNMVFSALRFGTHVTLRNHAANSPNNAVSPSLVLHVRGLGTRSQVHFSSKESLISEAGPVQFASRGAF